MTGGLSEINEVRDSRKATSLLTVCGREIEGRREMRGRMRGGEHTNKPPEYKIKAERGREREWERERESERRREEKQIPHYTPRGCPCSFL